MKAGIYVTLTRDEIQKNIPYAMVCETMSGARWNTMRRKRMMKARFTDSERDAICRLHKQAREWYLIKGVPDEIKMTLKTLALWHKLADFCFEV